MRRWLPLIVIGLIVIAVVASRGSDNGGSGGSGGIISGNDERLAEAMCADLSDGFSLFQMHSQAVEHYRETGRSENTAQYAAATLEDLATREHCPQFRNAFEATLVYERWIAP